MGAVVGRRVLLLLVATVMAVMMSMGPALAQGGGLGGNSGGPGVGGGSGGGNVGGPGVGGSTGNHQHLKNNKVYVCHKGNTLYVSKKTANWYVQNYKRDYWGPCLVK